MMKNLDELKRQHEALGQEIERLESKQNIVTRFELGVGGIEINGEWSMSILQEEKRGSGYYGMEVSGHKASAYLTRLNGTWYNQDGEKISGYLYWKPNGE